jgi:hypothetical protein
MREGTNFLFVLVGFVLAVIGVAIGNTHEVAGTMMSMVGGVLFGNGLMTLYLQRR